MAYGAGLRHSAACTDVAVVDVDMVIVLQIFYHMALLSEMEMNGGIMEPSSSPPVQPEASLEDTLPPNFRTKAQTTTTPSLQVLDFLKHDLAIGRLEDALPYLWMVGRPLPPRPLNKQLVLDRKIIPTTDASLHLVWTSRKIFLKPLPECMMLNALYQDLYVKPSEERGHILGFLHTYIALVPTKLDFDLAVEHKLMPSSYEWMRWKRLVHRFLQEYPNNDIYPHLHTRYVYGELRLSRLNKVYRFRLGHWLHGYSTLTGHTRYVDLLVDHLSVITASTIYIVVVLNAMQVALSTKILATNMAFQRACYGFAVFSIISPIIAFTVLVGILAAMVVANLQRTLNMQQKRFEALGIEPGGKGRQAKRKDITQSA
ncbi:hypothetical protein AC578_5256 [Pseudocercospora eumusae]|uniref:Uncharacterized protein n=1 Tax=Pseudocercospora eumusae TaxID=321146 RepID=A0A139GZC8_9PEZI|nr:hypothetical protein AC578_5256 [Pseudocercospora eumusae]